MYWEAYSRSVDVLLLTRVESLEIMSCWCEDILVMAVLYFSPCLPGCDVYEPCVWSWWDRFDVVDEYSFGGSIVGISSGIS